MANQFKISGGTYIIAGPCSIESREQWQESVAEMERMGGVRMMRCGVWKPRTRPGGFEGLGEEALEWIEESKRGGAKMKFCCEVASGEHVEKALKHGIDAVWIGARTTGSPFAVQEVAEALRGSKTPVLVKNAPNPDVHLWMGAIERCLQAGVEEIAAVHRGFDLYNNLGYRNNPLWEVPMELKRLMPELPILCDPSHISGDRTKVAALSQTALDLHFDGLMIEAHPHPEEALTDRGQQIGFVALREMIGSLVAKCEETTESRTELQALRTQIDAIDRQMLQMLADRLEVSKKIAVVKREENITVFQPKRWNEVVESRLKQAEEYGLEAAFVKELLEKIHAESVRVQTETTEGEGK